MKEKNCLFCGTPFVPSGRNQKYCCKEHQYKHSDSLGIRKEYRDRAYAKMGKCVGVGSGGLTQRGSKNPNFTTGRWAFRNFARNLKLLGVPCQDCGVDLKQAKRGDWVGHHKDHNPNNNDLNNLVLLCKKCHHYHHEAYRNLPSLKKVQRLSRKGVESSALEAQSPSLEGDDIV